LVKPWSTWVITSKTSPTITSDPLNQVHTPLWSNPSQPLVKTSVKPLCLRTSSRTFAAFSKFHLNTAKSPNIKVVQFFKGHNFSFGTHLKFGVENGENDWSTPAINVHQRQGSCKLGVQFMQKPSS
jgi:hypothetical protein